MSERKHVSTQCEYVTLDMWSNPQDQTESRLDFNLYRSRRQFPSRRHKDKHTCSMQYEMSSSLLDKLHRFATALASVSLFYAFVALQSCHQDFNIYIHWNLKFDLLLLELLAVVNLMLWEYVRYNQRLKGVNNCNLDGTIKQTSPGKPFQESTKYSAIRKDLPNEGKPIELMNNPTVSKDKGQPLIVTPCSSVPCLHETTLNILGLTTMTQSRDQKGADIFGHNLERSRKSIILDVWPAFDLFKSFLCLDLLRRLLIHYSMYYWTMSGLDTIHCLIMPILFIFIEVSITVTSYLVISNAKEDRP